MKNQNLKVSQNFLHNPKTVQRIVELSNITKEDTVLEIGPGKGIITDKLSSKAKNVIAIEYDYELYKNLVEKKLENVSIVNTDFLKYKFENLNNIKIFSNIPFNLTTDIFSKVIDNYKNITDFYFIMQKETAYRFLGEPYCSETSKSLLLKPIFEGKIIFNFNKTDFYPIPNVNIVLVHFRKKEFDDLKGKNYTSYLDLISYLYVNYVSYREATKSIFSFEQQKKIRKEINIDWEKPISSLKYEQWLKIFNAFYNYGNEKSKIIIKNSYKKNISRQKSISQRHGKRLRKFES